MIRRRTALLDALPLLAMARGAPAAFAQDFPARPVRIVVPYGPGGASDIVVRLLAQHAGTRTGQNFVVENRGGGASIPGTQAVISAAPDGYTIGSADNALSVNPGILKDRMPFDVARDLAPLGVMVEAPLLLVAHPSASARSAAEFVAAARAAPAQVPLAHGGTGTPTHLMLLQMRFGLELEVAMVGYRGGGPQLAGMVAGDTPYGVIAVPSGLGHVQAGRLRPLAVTGPVRSAALPEVPTFAEAGFPAMTQVGWWALVAPAAVREPILDRLNAILVAEAVRDPEIRAKLESQGYRPVGGSRAEFAERLAREVAHWREVFARPGVAAD